MASIRLAGMHLKPSLTSGSMQRGGELRRPTLFIFRVNRGVGRFCWRSTPRTGAGRLGKGRELLLQLLQTAELDRVDLGSITNWVLPEAVYRHPLAN